MIANRGGPPAISVLSQAARLTATYGPTVVRGAARGAGLVVEGTARGSMAAVGLVAQGIISGGQHAGRAAVAATNLIDATEPASHRGRDFRQTHGISVGRTVTNMLLARHALN